MRLYENFNSSKQATNMIRISLSLSRLMLGLRRPASSLLGMSALRPMKPLRLSFIRFNLAGTKVNEATSHSPSKESLPKSSLPQIPFDKQSTPELEISNPPQAEPAHLRRDLIKLIKLAKPEFKILVFAFACLLVTSATSMTLPLFIGKIIDTAKLNELSLALPIDTIYGFEPTQFYAGVAVLFTVGAIANFGRMYLLRSVGERLAARLRSRLFLNILSQDSYFFDIGPTKMGMKTGDLILRLSSDTQVIAKTLSGNVSDGARALISGAVGLTMMWLVSWKLTLCMSLIFPPLIVMSLVYGRRIKSLSRLIQENLGVMTKVSEEKLNGLKTIQAFSKQRDIVHEYNVEIKKIFDTSMREGKLSAAYYGINGFLGNASIIGLLVVGTNLIGSGEITIGDLSSFMMYALYTGSSVFGLGNFYTELMKGLGAAERIFELSESKPSITTCLGKKVEDLHGPIDLNISLFKYPSRLDQSPIFSNLKLHVDEGENVCIVGPSGSGKSTLSQLLLRFYDPLDGAVLVNGYDIKDLNLNYYRSQLGYVQQEPLLFSGTIKENVLFGKSDATDEEIQRAIELSNAKSFIDSLPQGLETVIGPSNSTQLSGGQKQRVSIARTIIRKPQLIILDEATSALDSISEEIVMRNLAALNRETGVTLISIAHRLSTIRNSDRVIVLNGQGEIVEDGKFVELFADGGSELNKLLKSHEGA